MRREDAIKKLGKLLGKNLAYRVNPKAPDQDERNEARDEVKSLNVTYASLDAQVKARAAAVLAADEEYQKLKQARAIIEEQRKKPSAKQHAYRFEAGIINPRFGWFEIKAQGDSWEDVIAKLTKDKVPS